MRELEYHIEGTQRWYPVGDASFASVFHDAIRTALATGPDTAVITVDWEAAQSPTKYRLKPEEPQPQPYIDYTGKVHTLAAPLTAEQSDEVRRIVRQMKNEGAV